MFNSPFGGGNNASSSPFGGAGGFGGNNNNQQQQNTFGSTGGINSGGGGLFSSGGGGMGSMGGGSPFGQAAGGQRSTTFPASPTLQRGTGLGGTQTSNVFGGMSSSTGMGQSQPFGSSTGGSQPFGGGTTTGGFGGGQSTGFGGGGGFGGAAPSNTGAFGAQQSNQAFGASNTNAFGQPGGGFGQQQQQLGTGVPPYAAPTIKENVNFNGKQVAVTNVIHAITAMPQYENKSFEELRFEDYKKRQGGGQQQPAAGGFGMGAAAPAAGASPFGGSAFGGASNTNAATPFGGGAAAQPFGSTGNAFGSSTTAGATGGNAFGGNTSGSPFGGAPTTGGAFGAPQSHAFGASSASTPFGGGANTFGSNNAQPASNNTFGGGTASSTPAFGQNTATSSFGAPSTGFGSMGSTGAFGSSGSTGAFGAPSAAPAFGASTSQFGAAPVGGTQFGATNQQAGSNAFGASTTSNAFGSSTTNAFGSSTAAPAFGSTQSTGAPSFGGAAPGNAFGSTAAPSFGSTAPTSGFGSSTGTTTSFGGTNAFGSSPNTAAPAFGSTQPTTGNAFASSGGFGSSPAGGNAWGGALGQAAKPAATSSFGGATSSFGSFGSGGTSAFGAAAPAAGQQPTSSFGSFGSFGGGGSTAFGQTQQPGQQTTSSFGGGMFGGAANNTAQQQQPQAQLSQNQGSFPTVSTSGSGFDVLDKKFDYLHRRKDALGKSSYGGSSSNVGKVDTAKQPGSGGSSPAVLHSSSNMGGNGYRHTPLQQSSIYRSPSLRALSGPQRQDGTSSFVRSKSNQQLSELSSQYMTPKGSKALSSTGRFSANDSLSAVTGSGLLFSGSGNSLAVSASKQPKRLVIEPSSAVNVGEVSVDDICRRAVNQVSGVGTPKVVRSVERESRSISSSRHEHETAVVSDDEDSPADRTTMTDEKFQTPAGKTVHNYSFKDKLSETPAIPPKISASNGYITSPDIKVLQEMDAHELRHVYHFTVLHPKYGKIVWEDDCDLTGLDLDDIIEMEVNSVSVYEGKVEKPDVGNALNKPAIITLYNVKPHGNLDANQFVDKMLKPACEKDDADFISYDEHTLEWTFKVYHFSRYGLAAEDDDQQGQAAEAKKVVPANENSGDASNSAMAVNEQGIAKTATKNFTLPETPVTSEMDIVSPELHRSGASLASTLGFDQNGLRRMRGALQTTDSAVNGENEPEPGMQSNVATIFEKSFKKKPAIASTISYTRSSFSETLLTLSQNALTSCDVDSGTSFCAAAMKAAEQDMAASGFSKSAGSTRVGGRVDAAVLHRKSFRAGFDGWGRVAFASVDKTISSGVPCSSTLYILHLDVGYRAPETADAEPSTVSAFDEYAAMTRAEKNDKCFVSCLESMLDASHISVVRGSDDAGEDENSAVTCPQWLLPNADPSAGLMEEYIKFVLLMNNVTENFKFHFKEALSRGCSTSDPKVSMECMGHDQEWITLQCVKLLNAVFGQEMSWLQRFRSGAENTVLTTMLPCDGEHESTLAHDEDIRQRLLLENEGDRNEIHFAKSQIERRRAAISEWLQEVCMTFGEQLCGYNIDEPSTPQCRIFDLLSAHKITEAVDLAESAGLYRLAMLLSQLGGDPDFAFLMRQQLESWFQCGADEYMDKDLLDVYKLLGSDMSSSSAENEHSNSVLSRVSWIRGIGLLFWYSCSCVEADPAELPGPSEPFFLTTLTTVQVAVDEYIRAVECGVAMEPHSPVLDNLDAAGSSHALFSLMLFCSGLIGSGERDPSVERLIADCRGFTSDPMNHKGAYLILMMLKCLDGDCGAPEAHHISIVRQHVLSELLYSGEWTWAVFVAMQIPDPVQRDVVVRQIVLRYSGGVNWESLADNSSAFIVDRLNVPDVWVHEATAYRLCCETTYEKGPGCDRALPLAGGSIGAFKSAISWGSDEIDRLKPNASVGIEAPHTNSFFRGKNMEVAYLGLAGMWDSERANRIISSITGPYALFSSAAASEKLLELLLQVEQFVLCRGQDVASGLWSQGSGALLTYLRFRERYSGVRTILTEISSGEDVDSDLQFIASARDELCELYRDAVELMNLLKERHAGIWKSSRATENSMTEPKPAPNFSTVAHVYLCNELFQCLCMLHSVIMSSQFRGLINAQTVPDPLSVVCKSSAANRYKEDFPMLTKSFVSSTSARLNAILTDRRGALSMDLMSLAV